MRPLQYSVYKGMTGKWGAIQLQLQAPPASKYPMYHIFLIILLTSITTRRITIRARNDDNDDNNS